MQFFVFYIILQFIIFCNVTLYYILLHHLIYYFTILYDNILQLLKSIVHIAIFFIIHIISWNKISTFIMSLHFFINVINLIFFILYYMMLCHIVWCYIIYYLLDLTIIWCIILLAKHYTAVGKKKLLVGKGELSNSNLDANGKDTDWIKSLRSCFSCC